MTEASPIPPPRTDDDEDVHWALSTASALWARGDTGEALKWLRRAAETASDQNRDQRSLELFKAAADATSLLDARGASTGPAGASSAPPAPSNAPPAAGHGAHAPPRTSGTPPPPRVSATPPPPRVSATPQPPLGSSAPPPRISSAPVATTPRPPGASPVPATVAAARAVLKQTLPSESGAPSGPPIAAKRSERKSTLDDRFQFPDDEVTIERDVAALRRARAAEQAATTPSSEAAVSATAATTPHPQTGGVGPSAPGRQGAASASTGRPTAGRPAPRSAAGAAAAARGAAARSGAAASPGPVHVTATRTVISAGTPKPSGTQPAGGATPSAAQRAMSRQVTRRIETVPPPLDDLDEQTSVLSGDEAELEFAGSETGENAVDDPRTQHDDAPSEAEAPAADVTPADASDLTPGSSSSGTDEPPYAPSIRPQPLVAEPARGAAAAWPTLRVALRRDGGGVRIEALGVRAATPPGAVAALLVAQDPASADALAKLLEPR